VLYLGCRIARDNKWLRYDSKTGDALCYQEWAFIMNCGIPRTLQGSQAEGSLSRQDFDCACKRPTASIISPLGILPSIAFLRIIDLLAPFTLFSLSVANPTISGDPWRIAKVLLLGCSAMGSFGTGMASLQLDMESLSKKTQPADMRLRVGCSAALGTLAVLYLLWFVTHACKARWFLKGVFVGSVVCWLSMRFAGSASDHKAEGSSFIWLDKLNLSGLLAVVAGILNSERGIPNSLHGQDDGADDNSDSNDDGGDNDDRRRDDGDTEDQISHCRRNSGRQDQDTSAEVDLADLGLSFVAQSVL